LVCIPNPDSPTGTVFDFDELERLIIVCEKNNTIILIDEAYFPFCDITAFPLIERYNNLVIARTFAKAWGMAGLRIGYVIGDEKLIHLLHKVRPMYEINSVAAAITEKMLDKESEMLKSVQRLQEGRTTS
jgi:histidinol-phosphate aminotransferase